MTGRDGAHELPDTTGWFPSRYGPGDEAGALNEILPGTVVGAAGLVRTGAVHDLSRVLDAHVPAFPGRSYRQHLTTTAHHVNTRNGAHGLGANAVNWIVEQVSATQQMGTHVDGLNHLQVGDLAYNGHRLADIVEEHGTSRLGIESLPQVVTRGVLVDVAAVRGEVRLGPGDVITIADTERALAAVGTTVRPGDAVLFHTGWGGLWDEDPARYGAGEPGPGIELAAWLAERRVALTGCDTWSYGPVPPEDADRPFAVPQTLNVRHGIVVVENLALSALAAARPGPFLFVLSHARLRGATGAWVAPLAVL